MTALKPPIPGERGTVFTPPTSYDLTASLQYLLLGLSLSLHGAGVNICDAIISSPPFSGIELSSSTSPRSSDPRSGFPISVRTRRHFAQIDRQEHPETQSRIPILVRLPASRIQLRQVRRPLDTLTPSTPPSVRYNELPALLRRGMISFGGERRERTPWDTGSSAPRQGAGDLFLQCLYRQYPGSAVA